MIRRVLGGLGGLLFAVVVALAVAEIGFRVAGWALAEDPARAVVPDDDHFVILCVGDSHTWGLGQGFPAYLAKQLAARSTRYRVLNLGVAGSNTAVLRTWLPSHLDRFRPRVVILWSGLNNYWNRRDAEVWSATAGIRPASLLRRVLEHSRTWRFFRAWRHHSDLRRLLASGDTLIAPPFFRKPGDPWERERRQLLDDEEVHFGVVGEDLKPDEIERVTELDVRWLGQQCRERGVPLVVVTYAIPAGPFVPTNTGIERAAAALGVPVVSGLEARARVAARYGGEDHAPPLFDKSVHPTQLLYDEIGAMILETLDRERLLPE